MEACFLKRQFPCCLTVSAGSETSVVSGSAFMRSGPPQQGHGVVRGQGKGGKGPNLLRIQASAAALGKEAAAHPRPLCVSQAKNC